MSVSILPARHDRMAGFTSGLHTRQARFEPRLNLSSAVAGWANSVGTRRPPWSGRSGDRAVSIGVGGLRWDGASATGPMLDFTWQAGGTPQVLSLPKPIAEGLLAAVQPGLVLPSEPARSLVLELALEPLLARFELQAGQSLQLVAVGDAAASGPFLELDIAYGQLRGQGRLYLFFPLDGAVPQLFAAIATLLERLPLQRRELPADFPVIVAGEIGSLRAGMRLLREARPGDVLLPEDCLFARGQVALAVSGLWAPAELMGDRLRLLGRFCPRSNSLESVRMSLPTEPAPPLPDASLDDVEVTLVFECGRWPMTLGALRTVGEGHVFELGRPLNGPVDIIANGRRIGRGDIVRVGDALGVRLHGRLAGND